MHGAKLLENDKFCGHNGQVANHQKVPFLILLINTKQKLKNVLCEGGNLLLSLFQARCRIKGNLSPKEAVELNKHIVYSFIIILFIFAKNGGPEEGIKEGVQVLSTPPLHPPPP